jgi:tetratricopeptide (TPR) repeat protein
MKTSTILTPFTGFQPRKQKWRFCVCIAALLSLPLLRSTNAADGVDASELVTRNSEAVAKEAAPDLPTEERKLQGFQAASEHAKAFLLLDEGSFAKAVETQRKCISLYQEMLGNDHWQTRGEGAFLAEMECAARFDEGQKNAYLDGRKKLWRAEYQIGQAAHDDAETSLTEALKSFDGLFVKDTFSIAVAWDMLGLCRMMREDNAKAKEYLIRATAAKKVCYGADHPEASLSLARVGSTRVELNELDQAEIDLREALHQERKIFGVQSPRYADVLVKLSRLMLAKKRLPEAEALILQSMAITQESQNQENIVLMAADLYNLGNVHLALEEYDSAKNHLQRSLSLYERFLPSRHPIIRKVMDRYAVALRKLGRDDEAVQMENRAKEILAQKPSPTR